MNRWCAWLVAAVLAWCAAPGAAQLPLPTQPQPQQPAEQQPANGEGQTEQPAQPAPPPGPTPDKDLLQPRLVAKQFFESYRDWQTAPDAEKPAKRELASRFISLPDLTEASRERTIVRQLGEIILGPPGSWRFRFPEWELIQREPQTSTVVYPLPQLEGSEYRVTLSRNDLGEWRFSAETVAQLQEMYEEVFPERGISGFLRQNGFGVLADNSFLEVAYWRWIALFLLILAGVVIDFISKTLTSLISRRFIKASEDDQTQSDSKQLIVRAARPIGLFASALFVFLLLPMLDLPPTGEGVLRVAARTLATLAAVWAAYRMTDLIAEFIARRAARTSSRIDDLLIPLLRKAFKIFVTAMGVVYIANSLDIEILPLLTGLGIGGLAFAFAAKDTIENFFGSIAVIADRPFEVGDWVNIDGLDGTVEQLGLRSTRIRTFYNSLVTIPNATLVRARVDNYGRRLYRRYKTTLNMTYDTPPDKLEAFCEGIREIVRKHPYTRKDFLMVHVNDFGPHSIDILVYTFFRCPDWPTELRERQRLILDIVRLAHAVGVDFAFPTQTLHLRNETGEPVGVEAEVKRLNEGSLRDRGKSLAMEIMRDAEFRDERPLPAKPI